MRTLFSFLILLSFISSELLAKGVAEYHNEEGFLNLINENMELRKEGIDYYQKHRSKFSSGESLTNEDLQNIYSFSARYLKLRSQVLDYIYPVRAELGSHDGIIVRTDIETRNDFTWYGRKIHLINPSEEMGKKKLRKFKMATVSALILYDNYLTLIAPYYAHDKIRYLLNRDFPGEKHLLDELTQSFFSTRQRKDLFQGLEMFEKSQIVIKEEKITQSSFDRYLNQLITSSPIVDYLKEAGTLESGRFTQLFIRLADDIKYTTRGTAFQSSKLFGNAMGVFQSRDGVMKNFDEEQKERISSRLRPLDVLLEKTPFRLTDSFIPGYYGHVAIWVGTEDELRELGVWDHPVVRPYHEMIRAGHHIVEALRPGVQINTLGHFLDIDDLAVIRPNDLTREQTQDYLIRAFSQIGKAYDFNFDVETDRLIVCSEIAYVVYHHVKWPTDRMMGRTTISPDHVAWEGLPGRNFTPVLIYQNGIEIEEDIEEVFLQNISGPEGLEAVELLLPSDSKYLSQGV